MRAITSGVPRWVSVVAILAGGLMLFGYGVCAVGAGTAALGWRPVPSDTALSLAILAMLAAAAGSALAAALFFAKDNALRGLAAAALAVLAAAWLFLAREDALRTLVWSAGALVGVAVIARSRRAGRR